MHTAAFVYDWLVSNNLWKDVIQLTVAAIFGYFLARIPWKRQQKKQAQNQAELMERLNAETPGGIGDLASLLRLLPQAEREEGDDETDRAATQERLCLRGFLCSRPDPVC